ncbi:phosphate ABC transporter permease subunit PstC [Roseitalea porphyridii]|uniref:Phosphate transport system permease protein n=1 Tax=Roseitalea porphyridii TaxID=1852022 RepID=A0A4P6UYU2_9HYPH|nr:phosphate ABC transporter permease subunit PstC [Roseitalea porphyridii]QBK29474.1 phosphate ABC transporter permease subunit PstC [Roseitalea porphyridii]
MSVALLVTIVLVLGAVGYLVGAARSRNVVAGETSKLHSRPGYYGSYVLIWATIPALLVLAAWVFTAPVVIENQIQASIPANERIDMSPTQQGLAVNMVESIARGLRLLTEQEMTQATAGFVRLRPLLAEKGVALAGEGEDWMIGSAQLLNRLTDTSRLWRSILVLGLSFGGFALAFIQIRARLRARNRVEGVIHAGLVLASTVAILTTIGIVLSMLSETGRFFSEVPPQDFFFGTVWDPRFANAEDPDAAGQFGLIPLLAGTLYIAFVAMLVAVPIGLFAAVYMSEYAGPRFRAIAKPLLEVLAGIPTIVYGFFALITVGPFLRDLSAQISGIATGDVSGFISAQSVLTAGLVMGIMLIPFVSSLSDDIISAVPRSMRDGSLGLGATRSETVKRVILPAALPGVVGALLMTASRAIGETMIVVMAAGIAANLTINPFEPMTTVTVKIVSQLTGDLEFTSPQTLVAFALGITLFFITLALNVYALYIVRKYREQYE